LPSPKIVLADYDPGWADAFRREAGRVRLAFGAHLVALHHIGSTAVPGLPAKPVIDILAVVSNVHALDAQTGQFEELGYEVMGEFGLPGRRYFRRDDPRGVRTHQIHTYAPDSSNEIERHLNFRDYLRAHQEAARAYANLKHLLANDCHGDMRCYSDGKTAFVRAIEQRAARWKRTSSRDHRPYNDR